MDYEAASATIGTVLSKVDIKSHDNNPDHKYHHLKIEDWLELDEIKYEIARDVGDAECYGLYVDDKWLDCDFGIGNGLAKASLRFNRETGKAHVWIGLLADPSVDETDGYSGDDHQAWVLFQSMDPDDRQEFEEVVVAGSAVGLPTLQLLKNAEPPARAQSPKETYAEQFRELDGGLKV